MKINTLLSYLADGQLPVLASIGGLSRPLYRAAFLAGASSAGLLRMLAPGPASFDAIAAELAPQPHTREALLSWLEFGVRLGELRRTEDGFALRSHLARRLAAPTLDAAAAILEEAAGLHVDLLRRTPLLSRQGRRFTLADQDGAVIARSSRVLTPLVHEALERFIPASGPVRLLEIGCGSGVYIHHALGRNQELSALGLELQPEVAEIARHNLQQWGWQDRVVIETGDLRQRPAEPDFDRVTLHNNIYYFPVAERVAVLRHARGFLRPGGRLLVTTGCHGGSLMMAMLDLWGATTEGCGPLPRPDELTAQLQQAGFRDISAHRLIPTEAYFAFEATASPSP